jgi:hypothetical protein
VISVFALVSSQPEMRLIVLIAILFASPSQQFFEFFKQATEEQHEANPEPKKTSGRLGSNTSLWRIIELFFRRLHRIYMPQLRPLR